MTEQEQGKAAGDVEQPFDQLAANLGGGDQEPGQEELQKIMEQEEKATRSLNRFWAGAVAFLSAFMSFFYIYTAGRIPGLFGDFQRLDGGGIVAWLVNFVLIDYKRVEYQRGLYVMLTFLLILLLYPAISRSSRIGRWTRTRSGSLWRIFSPRHAPSPVDLLLIVLTVIAVGYYIVQFEGLQKRGGAYNETDYIIAVIGIILSLEVSRRVLGWSLTLIGIFFVLYMRFGYVLYDIPVLEVFAHRGRDFDRLATILYYDQEGVFGVMANVLVSYVILFIFFGAFLRKSGASRFFIDLPLALAGRSTGGPAKVSVVASALFGSISGSAIANTVSTGTFTIPLMKRAGFKPHVAGAIEPAASIGGMFMPPVMGAGAFLMAELTNIPYRTIVLISIVPAFLYFLSVLTMVHFEAKRQGLKGIDTGVRAMEIIRKEWYMSIPLLVIVVMMMVGYSPSFAAFWSIVACVLLMYTMPDNAADIQQARREGGLLGAIGRSTRRVLRSSYDAAIEGARDTLVIGATVGVIGLIVGTIYATGIGLRFSDIIINLSNGNLFIAILLIGLASLILGMGVPVTAAYLIVAVLAVPALTDLGVALIAAHMIVYWFSQDSNITPPVCVAAYAGAAIAGADPWKTGWTSFKFAKLLYVMPLLFAYTPAILMVGHTGMPLVDVQWFEVGMSYFSGTLGTIAFSAATMFYLLRKTTAIEWLVFAFGTFLCFFPNLATDLAGIAVIALVWFWQRYDLKRKEAVTATA